MKNEKPVSPQRHRDTEKDKEKSASGFSLYLCVSVVGGFS
jgi:hypothetical protein